MKKYFEFEPKGVCAKKISFEIENGKLHNVKFFGGCPGNLAAMSRLLEGSDAVHIAEILKGNKCAQRTTSCADQLAIAIEEALNSRVRKAS